MDSFATFGCDSLIRHDDIDRRKSMDDGRDREIATGIGGLRPSSGGVQCGLDEMQSPRVFDLVAKRIAAFCT